ncbi:MAG: acetyl-CoA carboxylase biotin carboxyl carrier protein [Nitrospirae bacterium]|nr:acetyl-CoA carboxylase biotin carboxyl carrier protein [Nitrospirota bacterium]
MELDELKKIIELLRDTDITDLQIEKENTKVRIKRERMMTSIEIKKPPQIGLPSVKEIEAETQRLITITAPLVGTFYKSPSPDSPPFVEAGSKVKKGQVICIIEAMKLMNEIECDTDGILVRALVENAQPVEYGEPLYLIEPV